MPTYFSQATGYIKCREITPVMKAIFGRYLIGGYSCSNDGFAIARLSEEMSPGWNEIMEDVASLLREMNTPLKGDSLQDALLALHSAVSGNDADASFQALVRSIGVDDMPEMEELYGLAKAIDDGHGLEAVAIEEAFSCSKPIPGDFGGACETFTPRIAFCSGTEHLVRLASTLDERLKAEQPHEAALALLEQVYRLLDAIKDETDKTAVRRYLAERLVADNEKIPMPNRKIKHVAVVGRIPGDDEDSMHIFKLEEGDDLRSRAVAQFTDTIYDDSGEPNRQDVIDRFGTEVFINHVVASDVIISDVL